jgi:hypothetical protein
MLYNEITFQLLYYSIIVNSNDHMHVHSPGSQQIRLVHVH